MATSPDHPELQFVQAKSYGRGRPGKPLWIVVHDMEAGESSTRAESTANYFANLPDGRSVSSHYCVDNNSVVQCVRLADTAYTVGNSQGNGRGINWELSGFANQTRAQWLDPFGLAMFAQMAPIVRADAKTYGIPLEKRTVAELRAMKPGITSHNDLRLAFGGTTHTDPGPNFPWDVFLATMNGDDMAELEGEQKSWLYNASRPIGDMVAGNDETQLMDKNGVKSTASLDPYWDTIADRVVQKLVAGGYVIPPAGGAALVPHTHEGGETGPAVPTE